LLQRKNVTELSPDLASALQARFGARFSQGMAVREQHGRDESIFKVPPPAAVVFAESTQDVQDAVRLCAAHRAPVIAYPETAWITTMDQMIELNSQAMGMSAQGKTLTDPFNMVFNLSFSHSSTPLRCVHRRPEHAPRAKKRARNMWPYSETISARSQGQDSSTGCG